MRSDNRSQSWTALAAYLDRYYPLSIGEQQLPPRQPEDFRGEYSWPRGSTKKHLNEKTQDDPIE